MFFYFQKLGQSVGCRTVPKRRALTSVRSNQLKRVYHAMIFWSDWRLIWELFYLVFAYFIGVLRDSPELQVWLLLFENLSFHLCLRHFGNLVLFLFCRQKPDNSCLDELAADLIDSSIIHHKVPEIRLQAACCLSDVLRVYAPNAPYSQPQLQEASQLYFIYLFVY